MEYPLIQSVGIVVFQGEKVLLVRHGKNASNFEGIMGLPAGKIDPGETAIQTAQRELAEETGLTCEITDLMPLPHKYQGVITQKKGTFTFDWYVFWCRKYAGEIRGTEETEPFWVNVDEVGKLTLLPNVHEAIMTARGMQNE